MGSFFSFSWIGLSKLATDTCLKISELSLVVWGGVLAWGAIGEYLHEHNRIHRLPRWMRWREWVFIVMVVLGLIGEFAGDAGVFAFSSHLQSIEDADLARLGSTASQLEERLGRVDAKADTAESKSDSALENSDTAKNNSMTALTMSKGARNEADSFESDIVSAKKQATEANSKLADALQRVATAEESLRKVQSAQAPRHLTPQQREALLIGFAPLRGHKLTVMIWSEPETERFAGEIVAALRQAGVLVDAQGLFGTGVSPGVSIGMPQGLRFEEMLPQVVARALVNANLSGNPVSTYGLPSQAKEIQLTIGPKQ